MEKTFKIYNTPGGGTIQHGGYRNPPAKAVGAKGLGAPSKACKAKKSRQKALQTQAITNSEQELTKNQKRRARRKAAKRRGAEAAYNITIAERARERQNPRKPAQLMASNSREGYMKEMGRTFDYTTKPQAIEGRTHEFESKSSYPNVNFFEEFDKANPATFKAANERVELKFPFNCPPKPQRVKRKRDCLEDSGKNPSFSQSVLPITNNIFNLSNFEEVPSCSTLSQEISSRLEKLRKHFK
uniref:Uncharacterized protein n=1 Tax=Stomoxys calcitrans TaxID=35570 RepID=A0A1I8PBK6_STOCA|nr:unnamed protein product [Stomoxys calcitrans]